jgi:hypothetical protein
VKGGRIMKRITGMAATVLLMIGAAGLASAATTVPEVDPGMGMNALALLAGAVLVTRSALKK